MTIFNSVDFKTMWVYLLWINFMPFTNKIIHVFVCIIATHAYLMTHLVYFFLIEWVLYWVLYWIVIIIELISSSFGECIFPLHERNTFSEFSVIFKHFIPLYQVLVFHYINCGVIPMICFDTILINFCVFSVLIFMEVMLEFTWNILNV